MADANFNSLASQYQVMSNAGDPDWWMSWLIHALLTRQPILDMRGRYVDGFHDIPQGDRRYMRALRDLQRLARTNYCGLVTTAPVERMKVRGFRFGPAGTADSEAKKIWSANDMDFQSLVLHMRAAKYGMAYSLVTPPDPQSADLALRKYPNITVQDPRCAITYPDPVRPTNSLSGLRMWADDIIGHIVACLYLPDATYEYIGPETAYFDGWDIRSMASRLAGSLGGAHAFQLINVVPNALGIVPLTEYVWRPESGLVPQGEAGDDVRDIQDRINATMLDRIVVSRSQAYKQRYISGIKATKDKRGRTVTPFEPGASMVWATENENAKFGEFGAADISQISEAISEDVAHLAAVTKTPAHYLMGKMANVSGETLTQAESGLCSKTKDRMNSIGWAHERSMKLCFGFLGEMDKATDVEASTLWADPEQQTVADLALAGVQWQTVGWPLELIMERQGATPDEIDFAVQDRDRRQQETLQQQKELNQQTTNQNGQSAGGQSTKSKATGAPAPPKKTPGG